MTTLSRALAASTLAIGLLASPHAQAHLNVFACEPEWAALAKELGGDKVSVYAATNGLQDPHQVQARPTLIARARSADLVVCTGAELEIGWLPLLLRQSANPRIQPGMPGHFEAAAQIQLVDIPTRLSRSDGDVHAAGNPHIQTSAPNIRLVAVALSARMQELDRNEAPAIAQRTAGFLSRWDAATKRWEDATASLRGANIVVAHKNWAYLVKWLGFKEAIALEPKPGIPPGPAHIASVLAEIPAKSVRAVVYAAYEDPRPAEYVSERASIPAIALPFTVGGTDAARDLFGLFDDTVARLLAAYPKRP